MKRNILSLLILVILLNSIAINCKNLKKGRNNLYLSEPDEGQSENEQNDTSKSNKDDSNSENKDVEKQDKDTSDEEEEDEEEEESEDEDEEEEEEEEEKEDDQADDDDAEEKDEDQEEQIQDGENDENVEEKDNDDDESNKKEDEQVEEEDKESDESDEKEEDEEENENADEETSEDEENSEDEETSEEEDTSEGEVDDEEGQEVIENEDNSLDGENENDEVEQENEQEDQEEVLKQLKESNLEQKIQSWCEDNSNYEKQGRFDDIIEKTISCIRQIDTSIGDQSMKTEEYNQARICVNNIYYDDPIIKEDYMRLLFCFEKGYLEIDILKQKEISPLTKLCFEKNDVELEEQNITLMEKVEQICLQEDSVQDSIDKCIYKIEGIDSDTLDNILAVSQCIVNHQTQLNDLYPNCYHSYYIPYDELHEQFNEHVHLHCSDELENIYSYFVASDEFQKSIDSLKLCVNSIEFEDDIPKQQQIQVIDCYSDQLEQLQFNFQKSINIQ